MNMSSKTSSECNGKIENKEITRERIRFLQKQHNLTDAQAANQLNLSTDIYKNIKNGKNKEIDPSIIKKMSQFYKCTEDYIIGDSNDETLNKNGEKIIYPISTHESVKMIKEITDFLNKTENFTTLRSVHLLLVKLPPILRSNVLDALNSLSQAIHMTTLLDRKDSLSKEKFNYILENLLNDNIELTMMTLNLAKADNYLNKSNSDNKSIKKALHIYLEIIYYASPQSAPAAKKAITKITYFKNTWKYFPLELYPLINLLSKMQKDNFFNYPPKAETIISNYLSSQKINLKSRKEYISSFE